MFRIEFFNAGVEREIEAFPAGIRAVFAQIAQRMTEFGPDLGMPYTRAMGGGLFEIRARGAEGIARVLYCVVVERRIVLLRAFVKKTQATPVDELRLARKRLREVVANANRKI